MEQYTKSRGLTSVMKRALSVFPHNFPAKLYHGVSLIPPLKALTNVAIRSFIPPQINIEEGILVLNQKDVTVCGALALGMFEKRELDIFRKTLKPGMNVIDIGANIGLYAVIAAKRIGSNGRVWSFEPETENFSYLKKNIEANDLKNVTALSTALSDSAGERTLYLAKDNKGHHSFSKDSSSSKPVNVTTDTLDNVLQANGSPRVDLIKMDIEGAEPLALKGMSETLRRNANIILFTEVYPRAQRRLGQDPLVFLKTLSSYGLSIWIIDEDIPTPRKVEPDQFESYIQNFPKGESFHNLYVSKNPPQL